MYKRFFQLTRNPFDLVPDPTCFVSTKRHNEALAALYYGVRRHKGFIVVTGEVGTGKTLLLRCLLRLLKESKDVAYAYLFNSRLDPIDFLQYIVSDFGLSSTAKSKSALLLEFGRFLIARGASGQTTVLIIDEAHQLSDETLEEVRLLSNLETTDDKLLQIVLVGQPELDEKLDSVGFRQLKQRIALRAHLGSLDAKETGEYIERRVVIAGGGDRSASIFPPETIASIFHFSRGLPRLINSISENALVAAYARQSSTVTPDIIQEVAQEFRLESSSLNEDRARSADNSRGANVLHSPFPSPLQPVGNEPGTMAAVGRRGK